MGLQTEAPKYAPRERGTDLLYRVIEGHLDAFLTEADAAGKSVPGFVQKAFWDYLDCGILDRGFALLRCAECGRTRTVAHSCQNRGFCPSCLGRRMSHTAAHLVDEVLPAVPVRQWVLSLPIPLRFTLARNPWLRKRVLRIFLRAVFSWYTARARAEGAPSGQTGGVVVCQEFGSAINLNLHFHALVFDGTFAADAHGEVAFHATRAPTTEEIVALVAQVHARIDRLLLRLGLLVDDGELEETDDAQTLMQLASLSGRVALGERAGKRPRALIGPPRPESPLPKRCARSGWYSLHAGVRIAARDRLGRERLCRYILRPPLSHARLSQRADGQILLKLKTPWRNGTTALVLSPTGLLQRLAAIIPRPRTHQITYHGVLGGNARLRSRIVPTPPPVEAERGCLRTERSTPQRDTPKWKVRWIPWAQLLFRSFGVEGLRCDCGAWMRVHAIVIGTPATTRALKALQPTLLGARAPPSRPVAA